MAYAELKGYIKTTRKPSNSGSDSNCGTMLATLKTYEKKYA